MKASDGSAGTGADGSPEQARREPVVTPGQKESSSPAPTPKAGGKAKASKGKGRAPAVKGQPRPGKRRQSR